MVDTYVADNGTGKGSYKVLGQRKPCILGFERVNGRLLFDKDFRPPGMLYAQSLHTPYAHCKVTSMDTSAAEKLPGVHLVMNYFNFPEVFKSNEYLFAGSEIGAVVADDEDTCYKALQLITVQYEKLPFASNMYDAMKANAPLVGVAGKTSNVESTTGGFFSDLTAPDADHPTGLWNKRVTQQIQGFGDTDAAFAQSAKIIEVGSETDPSAAIKHGMAHYPSPRGTGATVDYKPNEPNITATVYSDNQGLYRHRQLFQPILNIPISKIEIVGKYCAFAGGVGVILFNSELTGWIASRAAQTLGQPVYHHYNSHEEALRTCHFASMSRVKIGFLADGKMNAFDMTQIEECGSVYQGTASSAAQRPSPMLMYNRHCRAVKIQSKSVWTNRLMVRSYCGFGTIAGVYAVELAMDQAAEALKMDPMELRKINAMVKGGYDAHSGAPLAYCSAEGHAECLDAVAAKSSWKTRWTGWDGIANKTGVVRHGIGTALKIHTGGSWSGTALLVKMFPDGSFECCSSVADSGQAEPTQIVMMTAEVLGLPYENGVLTGGSTAMPYSIDLGGSTGTWNHGYATWEAAMNVRKQVLGLGAELFPDAAGKPVDINLLDMDKTGVFLKTAPTAPKTYTLVFGRLASRPEFENRAGSFEVAAYAYRRAPNGLVCIPREKGACVVQCDVDTETGQITNVTDDTSDNMGPAMNPMQIENQESMGANQGLEKGLWQDKLEDPGTGRDLTYNWIYDYVSTHKDITVTHNYVELTGDKSHPWGATPGSEGQPNPHAAALGNAIYNAIGKRVLHCPFTPDKILKALGKV